MPASASRLADLQKKVWSGSIPLEIRLAASDCRTYDESDPYLVQPPRLSSLAFLLPRIHAFFAQNLINPEVQSHEVWLSFEGVPLKWHYPLGLLFDLFSGAEPVNFDGQRKEDVEVSQATVEATSGRAPLPWRLTVHFTDYPGDQLIQLDAEGRALLDSYINAVKEADYIRNGTARTVMSLSKEDSDNLWRAVQTRRFSPHSGIHCRANRRIQMTSTFLIQSTINCSAHPEWNFATSRSRSISQHRRAKQPPTLSQRKPNRPVTFALCSLWYHSSCLRNSRRRLVRRSTAYCR